MEIEADSEDRDDRLLALVELVNRADGTVRGQFEVAELDPAEAMGIRDRLATGTDTSGFLVRETWIMGCGCPVGKPEGHQPGCRLEG